MRLGHGMPPLVRLFVRALGLVFLDSAVHRWAHWQQCGAMRQQGVLEFRLRTYGRSNADLTTTHGVRADLGTDSKNLPTAMVFRPGNLIWGIFPDTVDSRLSCQVFSNK